MINGFNALEILTSINIPIFSVFLIHTLSSRKLFGLKSQNLGRIEFSNVSKKKFNSHPMCQENRFFLIGQENNLRRSINYNRLSIATKMSKFSFLAYAQIA